MMGGGKKIAGPGRLYRHQRGATFADRLLSRKIHPVWQGVRTKMFDSLPENMEEWEKYGQIRAESFLSDGNGEQATEYYRSNQEGYGRRLYPKPGANSFEEDEISAVQHGMNLYFRDRAAFL